MRVGAILSQADSGTDPVAIRRFATAVESAGYEHLMAYDHVAGVPASMFSRRIGNFPSPPYTDKDLFHEILVLFSHLSAVTTTLEFVTSVLVLPQRQAAVVAKQLATIDLLSGGRLHVAVGVGWNEIEYAALGTDFATRTRRLVEQMTVMRRLWTEPLVTFDGEFHHLDNVGLNPLPGRAFPLWMGTNAHDAALTRVIAHADGWMPLIIPALDSIGFGTAVARLRELCDRAGRDSATLPVWGRVYLADGWQRGVEEGLALGCTHFSIGATRGLTIAEQEHAVVAARADIDRLIA